MNPFTKGHITFQNALIDKEELIAKLEDKEVVTLDVFEGIIKY